MSYTNLKNLKEYDLSSIKKDDKITIIKQGEFGYPISIQLKVDSLFYKDYAQYRDCIIIQGKPPRKRKLRAYMIKPHDEFRIYKGLVDIIDTSKVISKSDEVTVTQMGLCFSQDTLEQASPKGTLIASSY